MGRASRYRREGIGEAEDLLTERVQPGCSALMSRQTLRHDQSTPGLCAFKVASKTKMTADSKRDEWAKNINIREYGRWTVVEEL